MKANDIINRTIKLLRSDPIQTRRENNQRIIDDDGWEYGLNTQPLTTSNTIGDYLKEWMIADTFNTAFYNRDKK